MKTQKLINSIVKTLNERGRFNSSDEVDIFFKESLEKVAESAAAEASHHVPDSGNTMERLENINFGEDVLQSLTQYTMLEDLFANLDGQHVLAFHEAVNLGVANALAIPQETKDVSEYGKDC